MAFSAITSWQMDGKMCKQCQILFSQAPKTLWMMTAVTKLKDVCSLEEKKISNLESSLKSRGITLPTNICPVNAIVFPKDMYGYESWIIKNAEDWRIDAFKLWCWKRLLKFCLLDSKKIKPVHLKGNQSWIFIGRTDVRAEAPIFWPPDVKSQIIGKDPNAGKDWGQEEKGSDRGWDGWMVSLI